MMPSFIKKHNTILHFSPAAASSFSASSTIFLTFSGHKCYVCAPNTRKFSDFQELKKMFGGTINIPKCSTYHRSRIHEFIQECPPESKGCLTQFEGKDFFFQLARFNESQFCSLNNAASGHYSQYRGNRKQLCFLGIHFLIDVEMEATIE